MIKWPMVGLFLITLATAFTADAVTLRFSCPSTPDMSDHEYVSEILNEAGRRAGHRIEIQYTPIHEALQLMRAGEVDGDCGRLPDFHHQFGLENYQPLQPAFRRVWFSSLKRHKTSKPYAQSHIGFIGPAAEGEALRLKPRRVTGYSQPSLLIEALSRGEIDYAIVWDAVVFNRREALHQAGIVQHQYLKSDLGHIFLHKRHRAFEKILSEVIEEKNQTNRYDNFIVDELPDPEVDTLVFHCPLSPKTQAYQRLLEAYGAALAPLGYKVKFVFMPRARSLVELRVGNIDGSCGIYEGIDETAHQLKLIPAGLGPMSVGVWANKRLTEDIVTGLNHWRIGYVRGTLAVEKYLTPAQKHQAFKVTSIDQAIRMLVAGRLDVIVALDTSVKQALSYTNLTQPLYYLGEADRFHFFPALSVKQQGIHVPFTQNLNRYMEENNIHYLIEGM